MSSTTTTLTVTRTRAVAVSRRWRALAFLAMFALLVSLIDFTATVLLYVSIASSSPLSVTLVLSEVSRALVLACKMEAASVNAGADYVMFAIVRIVAVILASGVHLAAWRKPVDETKSESESATSPEKRTMAQSNESQEYDDTPRQRHPNHPFPPPMTEDSMAAFNAISKVWSSTLVWALDSVLMVATAGAGIWFSVVWCTARIALLIWSHDQRGGVQPKPLAANAIALQLTSLAFASLHAYLYHRRRRVWFDPELLKADESDDGEAGRRRQNSNGDDSLDTPLLFTAAEPASEPTTNATAATTEEEDKVPKVTMSKQLVKIFRLAAPDWAWYVFAFTNLVLAVACETALPAYQSGATYALLIANDIPEFKRQLVGLALSAVGVGLFACLRGGMLSYQNQRLVIRLQETLFAAFLERSAHFFDTHPVGKLLSRLTTDTGQIGDVLGLNINVAARSILRVMMIVGYLMSVSWRLTSLIIAISGIFYLMSGIYGRYIRAYAKATQELTASSNHIAEQALSLFKTVKSHEAELWEFRRFRAKNKLRLRVSMWQAITYGLYTLFFESMTNNLVAVVLIYGYYLLRHGLIDVRRLTTMLFYSDALTSSMLSIADMFTDIMRALGASEEVFQLIDGSLGTADFGRGGENLLLLDQYRRWTGFRGRDEEEPSSRGGGTSMIIRTGSATLPEPLRTRGFQLTFDGVCFAYPKNIDRPVLKGMSWEVESGRSLALCGGSGSGKSTTISLIMRFYEPTGGRILVNGVNVMDPGGGCTPEDLTKFIRSRVSLVSQEPPLFSASIRENIAYASSSMDDSTVLRSAGVANARAFVEQMPDGFATMCGPRGARLSGGQKQRVAIARAVAKDPECLLLDEATSALDAESEQLVQESLERIMVGRTTVTIAHRLSTIRSADTICCVESGQVVESGTHDDLIAIEGAYYKLVSRQLSGSSVARSMNNLSTLAE